MENSLKEKTFKNNEIIISKTDLKGRILYCNSAFIKLSGYEEKEFLGKPHNIVRHPDMPRVVFKLLWEHVKNGKEIIAYVKNLCKDGSYYWVMAFVTPSFNENGDIVGYHSMRLSPKREAIKIISELYAKLIEIEKSQGAQESEKFLEKILEEKGVSYEEFILSL